MQIGYYIMTDIQHIPPVIRLYPHLGGTVFTAKESIYRFLQEKYADMNIQAVLCRDPEAVKKEVIRRRIRILIYTSFHMLMRGKAVQIFHGGLSDKNYVESVKILAYDLVLFPGEKTKDKVDRSGYLSRIPEWKIVGYPKFDPLINNELKVEHLFKNSRKTVLYAPTWISDGSNFRTFQFSKYGESSLPVWGKEIVRALCGEFNLIVKYHSRLKREPGDIVEQIENTIEETGCREFVKVVSDDNILPYMAQSDLMISDISTACYEWFHFDKPIVFANPSPEHYAVSRDIRTNTFAWQAGDVFTKSEEILPMVRKNLKSDSYRPERERIFRYTVFQPDGRATERQVQAIREFYQRFENMPYWKLILSAYARQRLQRMRGKFLNVYYRKFKRERIGR